MTPEGRVKSRLQKNLARFTEESGIPVRVSMFAPGSGSRPRGWPDFEISFWGIIIVHIETKRDPKTSGREGKLSLSQKLRAKDIENSGGTVYVLHEEQEYADFKAVIQMFILKQVDKVNSSLQEIMGETRRWG